MLRPRYLEIAPPFRAFSRRAEVSGILIIGQAETSLPVASPSVPLQITPTIFPCLTTTASLRVRDD